MKKLILLAILATSLFLLKPEIFSSSVKGAFDSNGYPQAWVFSFDGCGKPCDTAISTLEKRIDYIEFNISEEAAKQHLNDIGGGNNFPLTVIGSRRVVGSDSMQIISALAEVFGTDALTPTEQGIMESHFYEDNTPAVVMYGASWCGYCKKMRNYFDSNDIQYTELNAEGDAEAQFRVLKGRGFPLIYIGYRRIDGANIKLVEKTLKDLKI